MEWTKTPPSEPGWYYGFNYSWNVKLDLMYFNGKRLYWIAGSEDIKNFLGRQRGLTHWQGPLLVPEPPEEKN